MEAMVLHRQGSPEQDPLRLEQRPRPEPAAGQLLLQIGACGVCHTDLHIVRGDLPLRRAPLIPGHQIVGTVVGVGTGVDAGEIGRRVGVPWLSTACGSCRWCANGQENLCERATFTGWDIDGGFAEFVAVPHGSAHVLPTDYSDVEAAPLLCAGVIGYRSLRLAGASAGARVGLFGFGASGHLALQMALGMGCEVLVFTRSVPHRELALELGASWAGSATEEPPSVLDCAVTFAPAGWIVRAALSRLDRGGTLAINAIHMDEIPALDYGRHLYHERVLRSVANLTHADAREFLALAARQRLQTVVEPFPLAQANDALARLARSELAASAALVPGGRLAL